MTALIPPCVEKRKIKYLAKSIAENSQIFIDL